MIAQLNINLGQAGRSLSNVQLAQRWSSIDELVRSYSWAVDRSARKDRQIEHPVHDLVVLESVYIARVFGYVPGIDDQFIHGLADALDQGCIAVFSERTQTGSLIGSNPEPWGEFDNSRFVFIHEVTA